MIGCSHQKPCRSTSTFSCFMFVSLLHLFCPFRGLLSVLQPAGLGQPCHVPAWDLPEQQPRHCAGRLPALPAWLLLSLSRHHAAGPAVQPWLRVCKRQHHGPGDALPAGLLLRARHWRAHTLCSGDIRHCSGLFRVHDVPSAVVLPVGHGRPAHLSRWLLVRGRHAVSIAVALSCWPVLQHHGPGQQRRVRFMQPRGLLRQRGTDGSHWAVLGRLPLLRGRLHSHAPRRVAQRQPVHCRRLLPCWLGCLLALPAWNLLRYRRQHQRCRLLAMVSL